MKTNRGSDSGVTPAMGTPPRAPNSKRLCRELLKGLPAVMVICAIIWFTLWGVAAQLDDYGGIATFAAAVEMVNFQVDQGDIILFATTSTEAQDRRIGGRRIIVVANGDLRGSFVRRAGSYPEHHNLLVAQYAAFEYCHGDRGFGRWLLALLAEVDRGITMSTTDRPVRLDAVLSMLKTDPKEVDRVLSYQALQWTEKQGGGKGFAPSNLGKGDVNELSH